MVDGQIGAVERGEAAREQRKVIAVGAPRVRPESVPRGLQESVDQRVERLHRLLSKII